MCQAALLWMKTVRRKARPPLISLAKCEMDPFLLPAGPSVCVCVWICVLRDFALSCTLCPAPNSSIHSTEQAAKECQGVLLRGACCSL